MSAKISNATAVLLFYGTIVFLSIMLLMLLFFDQLGFFPKQQYYTYTKSNGQILFVPITKKLHLDMHNTEDDNRHMSVKSNRQPPLFKLRY